ncbi:MAG: amino acid ABC transporter permease, partial [Gemmatimonadetes bacterium]|nr:amino acid ABC transporter permease [Gemmatimonadota bacterium]
MRPWRTILTALLLCTPAIAEDPVLHVGSKSFTESVILGDMLQQLAQTRGYETEHERELGGTRILWNSLLAGELDAYVEYTGTIAQEILGNEGMIDEAAMRARVEEHGLRMTRPLGFNNTYAIGVTSHVAERRGLETISDLVAHPELVLGFSNEFMDRG